MPRVEIDCAHLKIATSSTRNRRRFIFASSETHTHNPKIHYQFPQFTATYKPFPCRLVRAPFTCIHEFNSKEKTKGTSRKKKVDDAQSKSRVSEHGVYILFHGVSL